MTYFYIWLKHSSGYLQPQWRSQDITSSSVSSFIQCSTSPLDTVCILAAHCPLTSLRLSLGHETPGPAVRVVRYKRLSFQSPDTMVGNRFLLYHFASHSQRQDRDVFLIPAMILVRCLNNVSRARNRSARAAATSSVPAASIVEQRILAAC